MTTRQFLTMVAAFLAPASVFAQSKGGPQTAPELRVQAESFAVGKAALAALPGDHHVLTADGRFVLYVAAGGVYAHNVGDGTARRLTERTAGYLRPTPHGRYVVVEDAPFTRLAVDGSKPARIVAGESAGRSPSLMVSNGHVAFLNATGTLVLASLAGERKVVVDLAAPQDNRCHYGAGVPRVFSPDGNYLSVQHGCDDEYLVETAQGALRKLPFISTFFVGGFAVGSPKRSGGMANEVVVLDPRTHESWTVQGVDYSPFRVAVPGRLAFVQVANDRLELVDLAAKKVEKLDVGVGRVTGFISTSADGRWAYYSVLADGYCSLHAADLSSGKHRLLARVDAGQQCFVRPLDGHRAAGYAWRSEPMQAIVVTIDVASGAVQQLGPATTDIGSLHTAGGTILLSGRATAQVGAPR